MNKAGLVFLGGGGHCKVVLSLIKQTGGFEPYGILDNKLEIGSVVFDNVRVIGTDNSLGDIKLKGIHHAFITVGSCKDNIIRQKLYEFIEKMGFDSPIICAPSAIIDAKAEIGAGSLIMHGCIVNTDTSIGKNCIINSGAIIEHDCHVGDHCHLAPGVKVSGNVKVGEMSFIGIGSTIIQGIKIGRNVTIGAGTTIIKDIPDNSVVVGSPGRIIRSK